MRRIMLARSIQPMFVHSMAKSRMLSNCLYTIWHFRFTWRSLTMLLAAGYILVSGIMFLLNRFFW